MCHPLAAQVVAVVIVNLEYFWEAGLLELSYSSYFVAVVAERVSE